MPPGPRGTSRAHILRAAREELSERGYEGCTIRGIADRADVNSSLIYYYFGSKSGLLTATLDDLSRFMASACGLRNPMDGTDLLRTVLQRWESPECRSAVLAVIRASLTHRDAGELLHRLLSPDCLGIRGTCPQSRTRPGGCSHAVVIAAQLLGLMMVRHVMPVEPFVSAELEQVVSLFSPLVQRHLADHELTCHPTHPSAAEHAADHVGRGQEK